MYKLLSSTSLEERVERPFGEPPLQTNLKQRRTTDIE